MALIIIDYWKRQSLPNLSMLFNALSENACAKSCTFENAGFGNRGKHRLSWEERTSGRSQICEHWRGAVDVLKATWGVEGESVRAIAESWTCGVINKLIMGYHISGGFYGTPGAGRPSSSSGNTIPASTPISLAILLNWWYTSLASLLFLPTPGSTTNLVFSTLICNALWSLLTVTNIAICFIS